MPISFREDDAPDQAELTPGAHNCTIRTVEDHTSKAGNLSIHLSARVDDGNWLHEYMPPTRQTVQRLCTACGVSMPEGNEFDEAIFKDRQFRAVLKIELGTNGYADKYRVDQWLKPKPTPAPVKAETKPVNKAAVAANVNPADDDIPF